MYQSSMVHLPLTHLKYLIFNKYYLYTFAMYTIDRINIVHYLPECVFKFQCCCTFIVKQFK